MYIVVFYLSFNKGKTIELNYAHLNQAEYARSKDKAHEILNIHLLWCFFLLYGNNILFFSFFCFVSTLRELFVMIRALRCWMHYRAHWLVVPARRETRFGIIRVSRMYCNASTPRCPICSHIPLGDRNILRGASHTKLLCPAKLHNSFSQKTRDTNVLSLQIHKIISGRSTFSVR